MIRDLSKILSDIKNTKELIAKSPDDFPQNTRAGFVTAQRQAEPKLEKLRQEMKDVLKDVGATVLLVNGPYSAAFVGAAVAEGVSLIQDANEPFVKLSEGLAEMFPAGAKSWSVGLDQFHLVYVGLKEMCRTLGIDEMDVIDTVPTESIQPAQLAGWCKKVVKSMVGNDLMVRYAINGMSEKLEKLKGAEKGVPMLIHGFDDDVEARAMVGACYGQAKIVDLKEEINANNVVKTFTSILRKKK